MLKIALFFVFCYDIFPRGRLYCWQLLALLHFVLYKFVIGYCGGEVGIMIDETLVCAPSGWCLYSLVVRLD
jgi:hypothetical protein